MALSCAWSLASLARVCSAVLPCDRMTRAWLLAGPVPRGVEVVGVGPAGQLIFDVSEPFNVDEEFNSDYVVRAELSPDSTSVKNLNIGAGHQKERC